MKLFVLAALFAGLSTPALLEGADPLALRGLDPVELVAGREVPGKRELSATRAELTYGFVNAENRAAFEAEPERFVPALDGRCAVMPGVPGSPDLFAVHAGRIYLFGSSGCRERFLADPASFTENEPLNVAIVVFEGVELLDFAGPGEVFAAAGHGRAFRPYLVSQDGAEVTSMGFVRIEPDHSIADCPPPDVLLIPGGSVGALVNDEMMAWLGETAERATHVVSVCNGAVVLGRLGVLDGLSATTHHSIFDELEGVSSEIEVLRGTRWVDNGKVITTAGISAGIDGSLHLVGRICGDAVARATARYMEVDWEPGNGTDLRTEADGPPAARDAGV